MNLVLDASVIVKWFFPERDDETHVDKAFLILNRIKEGAVGLIQPPHWLAEVAAVLVRLKPQIANSTVDLLYAMNIPTENNLNVYQLACALSRELNHHLFDTMYHALAILSPKMKFVTADEKYYVKAKKLGNILLLSDIR